MTILIPFPRLSARTRIVLAILLSTSGLSITATHLRRLLRRCRRAQQALVSSSITSKPTPLNKSRRSTIDSRFISRITSILRVCIPSLLSSQAALIALQTFFLCARTLLSNRITYLEGQCAANVTAQNWKRFRAVLLQFALTAIPASIVNSSLKSMQILVSLALRKKLTAYLHKAYLGNRAYYAASVFSGLSHADQRITDDVEKFCETTAELYSYTFKPFLDVLVFSRSLGQMIGYKGQAALYAYFIIIGGVLRRMSPPLGKMTAEFASLSADLRSAHHRVATSAEEVAFNDPPAGRAEMIALNSRMDTMVKHSRLTVIQRFIQQCFDGYLVKYTASIIGLTCFAVPLYYRTKTENLAQSDITGQYVNSVRLMMQTSSAMGELVLVYKRINTLAGHTARVSELMEKVKELSKPKGHLEAFRRIQERGGAGEDGVVDGSTQESIRTIISACAHKNPPRRQFGKIIKLEKVSMWSPEGVALVRDLNCEVLDSKSMIIVGPNGSGKSSILRMLAGLWPLQAGTVSLPARDELFYLSQRPYMYSGSLMEQLMYPKLPGAVIGDKVSFNEKTGRQCLESVQLGHLIGRCGGFEGRLSWDDTLSGGERNRLAVARLLYHKPRFAILDECTAAVSADGEVALYRAMAAAGITMLSVAHRQAVLDFHQSAVILDGAGGWEIKQLDSGEQYDILKNK